MNSCRETKKMGVPPGNPAERGIRRRADTRGRQEGQPYSWSQQVIHITSGLGVDQAA